MQHGSVAGDAVEEEEEMVSQSLEACARPHRLIRVSAPILSVDNSVPLKGLHRNFPFFIRVDIHDTSSMHIWSLSGWNLDTLSLRLADAAAP